MMNEIAQSRSVVDVFGGYNHNLRISDGEFYDMKNLTPSYYPCFRREISAVRMYFRRVT